MDEVIRGAQKTFYGMHPRLEMDMRYHTNLRSNQTSYINIIVSMIANFSLADSLKEPPVVYIAIGLSHSKDPALLDIMHSFREGLPGAVIKDDVIPASELQSALLADQAAILDYLVMKRGSRNLYSPESSFSMWLERTRNNPLDMYLPKADAN